MSGISDFKRLNKIGQGAFGIAWLVESKIDLNKFVIKEIGLYKMNEKERYEARREVLLLSKMNHPNIVAYYNSFEEVGCFHILMEYCEGGDLYRRMKAQNGVLFKEDQVLDYFIQICLALKHIHDQKILHRDLKPQNIFLTKNNNVKLGDFGIAKVMNSTTALTKTTVGTPFYFSPEICEGRPYNNKSDIWSLGCILYELCSLNYAFYGQDMTILAMQIKRVNYNPIPNAFSPQIRSLIDNMFRRRPDERPNISAILRKPFILKKVDKFLPPESPLSLESKKYAQKRPSTANVVSRVDSGLSNKKKNRNGNLLIHSPYLPEKIRNVSDKRLPVKVVKHEETKPNFLAIKQHELLNKIKADRHNFDRENGWKNVISSDDSKSDNNESKLNNKVTPPAAIKQKASTPAYDLYYTELDRIKEQQRLREKEGKALMQQMFRINENKPMNKYQNGGVDGVYRKLDVFNEGNIHGRLGVNAGDQARVVQEYLERQRQAKHMKHKDGNAMALVLGGANKYAAPLPIPQQTPRNKEEEIADRLNKIRQNNAELKKGQMFEDFAKNNEFENQPNFNPVAARKAMEELQKKLKQRTEDLRQKLEKKEKEKVKENKPLKEEDDRMNAILFPKRNSPVVLKIPQIPPQNISPTTTEQSSISVILKKLNEDFTPTSDKQISEIQESFESQPSLSVIFSQLDDKPSRPSTASDQSDIRKMKDDILKRLNTKQNNKSNVLEINERETPVRKSWIIDMDENDIYKNINLAGNETLKDVSLINHDDNENLRAKWKLEEDTPSDTMVLKNIQISSDYEDSDFDGSTITLEEPSCNVDLPTISEDLDNNSLSVDSKIIPVDNIGYLNTIVEVSQEITEIDLIDKIEDNETLKVIERENVWNENLENINQSVKEIKPIKLNIEEDENKNDLQDERIFICIEEDSEIDNKSLSSESDQENLIECLKNVLSLNSSPSNSYNNIDDEDIKTLINDGNFEEKIQISRASSLQDLLQNDEFKIRRAKSDSELNGHWDKDWLSEDTDEFSSEDFGDDEIMDTENIFLKIEKIRIELEEKIGIDPLMDAIEFVRENQDLNGDQLAEKLKEMIVDEVSINDILHLVVLEEQYNNNE